MNFLVVGHLPLNSEFLIAKSARELFLVVVVSHVPGHLLAGLQDLSAHLAWLGLDVVVVLDVTLERLTGSIFGGAIFVGAFEAESFVLYSDVGLWD